MFPENKVLIEFFFSVNFQVLHHFEKSADGKNFPGTEQALQEAKRVLHPNGIMFIGNVLPYSMKQASWIAQLDTSLTERYSLRFPSVEQYHTMVEKCHFKVISKLSILGSEMVKTYYDPEGPLKKEWRDGMSLFGLATDSEIRGIEEKVRKMNKEGTMEQFMKDNDKSSQIGFLTILTCLSTE